MSMFDIESAIVWITDLYLRTQKLEVVIFTEIGRAQAKVFGLIATVVALPLNVFSSVLVAVHSLGIFVDDTFNCAFFADIVSFSASVNTTQVTLTVAVAAKVWRLTLVALVKCALSHHFLDGVLKTCSLGDTLGQQLDLGFQI